MQKEMQTLLLCFLRIILLYVGLQLKTFSVIHACI